jgi:hypothetical protein
MRGGGVRINAAVTVCTLCCFLATAQAAGALEPGVHVDPGSPAAKEYALPLDQARQTGSESSSQPSSEGGLFGAGIKPPGSGGSSRGGTGGSGGSGAGGAGTGSSGTNRTGRALTPAQGASATPPSQAQLAQAALRTAREQGSGGGNGSILALVGGGVAILVLGGFGGTVLRHSRRPRPSA